jgi:hypothetical protein
MSRRRAALVAILALVPATAVFMVVATTARAEPPARGMTAGAPEDKRWQAVAPGRVEPCSGQIKVATSIIRTSSPSIVARSSGITR